VDGASAHSECSFLDGFRQGRVTVTGARDVLGRCAELHSHDDLVNQGARVGPDDMCAENPVGLCVSQDFHESVGLIGGAGATVGGEGEGAAGILDTGLFELFLGLANCRDFGR